MSAAVSIAISSTALAIVVAMFVVWLTAPWLRPANERLEEELNVCRSERDALRRRLDVLEHAIMQVLNPVARERLRTQLDRAKQAA